MSFQTQTITISQFTSADVVTLILTVHQEGRRCPRTPPTRTSVFKFKSLQESIDRSSNQLSINQSINQSIDHWLSADKPQPLNTVHSVKRQMVSDWGGEAVCVKQYCGRASCQYIQTKTGVNFTKISTKLCLQVHDSSSSSPSVRSHRMSKLRCVASAFWLHEKTFGDKCSVGLFVRRHPCDSKSL